MQLLACVVTKQRPPERSVGHKNSFRNALKGWVQTKSRHSEQSYKIHLSKAKNRTFCFSLGKMWVVRNTWFHREYSFVFICFWWGWALAGIAQGKKQSWPPINLHYLLILVVSVRAASYSPAHYFLCSKIFLLKIQLAWTSHVIRSQVDNN